MGAHLAFVVVGGWTNCFAHLLFFVVWAFGYFSVLRIIDTHAAHCQMANESMQYYSIRAVQA